MNTNKLGFTLIELLVVVAILGIIATLGINAYSGYVAGTKKQSAKNVMQQISLGQSEYVSQNGEYYYTNKSTGECGPTSSTSNLLEQNLLGNSDSINEEMGYELCTHQDNSKTKFKVVAKQNNGKCVLRMNEFGAITEKKASDC